MKANFNIAKNVRNSRSISALEALRKLQSLGLLLCALLFGSLQVWGTDYEKLTPGTHTLSDGDEILIAIEDRKAGTFTFIQSGSTKHLVQTVTDGVVSNPAAATIWIATASSSNWIFRMKDANSNGYLSNGGSNTTLTTSSSTQTTWAVSNNALSGYKYFRIQRSAATVRYVAWTGSTFGAYATSNFHVQGASSNIAQNDGALQIFRKVAGYAITWNNGGHGTAPTSPTNATSLTLSAITGVTGYTCTGWKANVAVTNTSTSATISAGTLIANGTNVTLSQATTFTAQWETAKYTVSFGVSPAGYGTVSQASVTNVPHGTVPSSSTNTVTVNGTTVTATPHAQDADYNYAFSSWSGIPGSVTSAVTITANFTRTARPLTNYRTSCASTFDIVLHDNNGGSHNGSATVAVNGTTLTSITPPTKSGFVVEGYYDDDSYSHKVAASDGTLQENVTGYTGAGGAWTKGSGATLYAKWTASYTVTYNANGGDGTMTDSNSPYASGSTVTVLGNSFTAPTGKEFDHWNTAANNSGASYNPSATFTISANTILYAQWRDVNYNVTYSAPSNGNYTIKVADGTATSATKTANYGQTITIAATPSSGYQFVSWTIRNTSTSADVTSTLLGANSTNANTTFTMPAYGVTVTASFVRVYTVTFVHHDKGTYSSGSTEWIVPSNDNTITLPTVTGVDCGFYDTFEGWITGSEYAESSDKPATVYAGGSSYTVTGDVTLRALYSYEDPDATGYTKITSGVTAGTYLISTNDGNAYAGRTGSNTYGDVEGVSVSAGVISSKGSAKEVTITMSSSNFHMNDGTYYLGYSGSSNDLKFNASVSDNRDLWKLDANGQIESVNVSGRLLEYNSGSPRFACYTGGQTDAFLFKKGGSKYCTNPSCSTPTEVTVTYNANGGGVGSITCSSETLDYGTYPALADDYTICNTFNRTGYTLYKWSTRADGEGGTDYDPGEVVGPTHSHTGFSGENVTLYAQWRKKVSFNIGNATGSVADVVDTDNDGNITLPGSAGISAIPCGYEFYGWRESSVSETTSRPSGMLFAGDTYNCASATLYAVYRLADGDVDPNLFSLSYTYSATKYYVSYPISSTADAATQLRGSTSSAEAAAFGVESVDFQTYKALYYMNEGVKEYLYWYTGDGTSIRHTPTKPTDKGWTINDGVGTKQLVPSNAADRNIKFNSDPSDPRFRPYQDNSSYLTVEEASGTSYTYATNPSCVTTATLAFVTSGGTLNYPTAYDASNYVDLTVGTNVYLPTATFPGEWEFVGWMKGSELPSQATSPVGDPNFYTVTLNTTQYTASPAGTTTFYAVYSKTVDDKQWDPTAAGTYKIFAIMSDGTTKKYMPVWGGTQVTLSAVTDCPSTGEYTITPGTGEHAGQYKITHGSYTLGVRSDGDTQFKNDADAWWNIEASTSGKGTYRITIVGSSNRCLSYSGFDTFGNYTISQVNSPSQPNYRDVEIGECIYTEYTSTPANIPYITISGSPVKITSANGQRVYAPTKIHIEAHNFTGTRRINFSATNGFATNPDHVNCDALGAYSGDIDIYYQPASDGTGSIVSSVLTASQAAESVTQTFSAIQGRNLPANFVIAVKSGSQWYALPDECRSSGTPAAVPIEVNDPSAPTAATLVPHNTEWRLNQVVGAQSGGSRPKDKIYLYEPIDNNYALKANSAPNISTEAQVGNIGSASSAPYEWGLTTTDLCAYTISNENVSRNISINESGNFGTHATNIVSSTLYLLPITAYYEPAKMQVLEWKANSVVVMYTGTQTTATTQVGSNSASSAQTLASRQLTHAVYELTIGQDLTANAGEALKVSFGSGAEIIYVTIPIIINSAVTASESHESQDVVIVNGGKLTAASTKYSFHNIYVYGGGKLKIASGSQLGVNNIIMRAGGVTTNGSGGSATYVYTYPQVELGGTLTSTVADIKYEYITDYDHWYHFCLPFNANLNTIHYPQEYYGDNVTAANTGSWVIKRYAGEVRATGSYDAWKDIETEGSTSVTAGLGYIFWGAPKKVGIGDATKVRQQWGIQRISMATAASAATTAEAANKNIAVDSYSDVEGKSTKPNDQGWNLVGNPYMVNLTGLSSESLIAGQLVHSSTVPWDGKWVNNGDGVRYVTIPDNHFDNYEARTMSWFTALNPMINGRTFFVQIAEGASTLTFASANRAALMPALYANVNKSVDIETGIVMSDETHKDEVNFWIKDGKTDEYEYNADYPKTMNQTNFNIYGVHSHGELSWVAISPEIAEGSMAIGYQVPTAGDYTLRLSETYVSSELQHVFVTDHGVSPEITTDLMEDAYIFHVDQAETNDERFTVSFRLKELNQEQGIEDVRPTDDTPQKFLYRDKIYILRGGVIYDATGKQVQINK